jgi:hypothetical protein
MLSDKRVLPSDKTRPQFPYVVFRIIQDIVAQIIHEIGALYKASEAVRLPLFLSQWIFAHNFT